MAYNKNDYKNYYYLTQESGDSIRANDNEYLKSIYSKKQLIDFFKKHVQENEDFSEKFKDFIQTSNNINYRMIYVSYYETSCDLYWDSYVYDDYDYRYVYNGTYYHSTLREFKYSPLLNIFKSINGIKISEREEGIDIVTDYNIVTDMYRDMVEAEKIRWDEEGTVPLEDIRNQKWLTLHVPVLIIGYEFEKEKYFSIINAVTMQHYIAGVYSEKYVLNDLLKKSQKDDYDAQFELGLHYEKQKKFQDAFYWYEKSSQKHTGSLNNLGYFYLNGKGCEKNYNKAFDCFKNAEKSNTVAIYNLGICYKKGFGCEKNIEKAIEYFEKANEKGYKNAQTELDDIYNNENTCQEAELIKCMKKLKKEFKGTFYFAEKFDFKFKPSNFTDKDVLYYSFMKDEIEVLKKHSKLGNGKATYYLGILAEDINGKGSPSSLEYFKKAGEQNYPLGLLHIARYTYETKKENLKKIKDLYFKFISLQNDSNKEEFKYYFANANYEIYYFMNKFKDKDEYTKFHCLYNSAEDLSVARKKLEKSKHKIALFFAGELCYKEGYINLAKSYYLKSAKKGFIEAQLKVAKRFEIRKPRKAKKWYKKAMDNKDNCTPNFESLKNRAKIIYDIEYN